MKKNYSSRLLLLAAFCAIFVAVNAGTPKYVFFFIGDGMGIGEVTNAQIYNREVMKNSKPLLMTTFPVMSMITTHSASSDVTDSAAAGTALATGVKTKNGMLGMAPDTTAVTSIAKHLFDDGFGIGLVTSVAIDDATPGAFYAHVANRGQYYEIGRILAESGYQFAAGAALRGTKDKSGSDNGLMDYFTGNNVSVSYSLDSLDPKAERQLVLSPYYKKNENDIGYTVDSIAGALTLPALTRAGLSHLLRVSPDRFFMMVEGGNIDHAGHGNDGGTSVREVINFNEALQVAYDFYLAHPDETLIVVTADHETGGMSVGCSATGYSVRPWNVAWQRVSKEMFNEYCKDVFDNRPGYAWGEMKSYLQDNFGLWSAVTVDAGEEARLHDKFSEIFEKRNDGDVQKTLYASYNGFVTLVFEMLNYKSGFGWTTGDHTGMPVPVYAIGAGSQLFMAPGDNTEIPKLIMKSLGKGLEN